MSQSKECYLNNNDILSNCLNIINAGGNTKKNTHRPSSHGIAAAQVRAIMDKRNLKNELKETWEE